MDLQIKNKNALITGGSRGLGKAAALHLAQEGVNVAICGRSPEDLASTAKEIENYGVSAYPFVCDITDLDALVQMHNNAVEAMGGIDILVNNVGGTKSRVGLEGTSMDDFKATFDLNVFSAFELMKLVTPGMKNKQWGRIVNIASIWGKEYGGNISYMTAKAALIAATKSAARELAKNGITINSVAPGSILHAGNNWEKMITENSEEFVQDFIAQNLPMGKFGWPEAVGNLIAYLCSDGAGLITGSCVGIDGGQSYSL